MIFHQIWANFTSSGYKIRSKKWGFCKNLIIFFNFRWRHNDIIKEFTNNANPPKPQFNQLSSKRVVAKWHIYCSFGYPDSAKFGKKRLKSVYPVYIYIYISQTIVGFFEVLVWKNGLRYGFKFFCASTLLAQYKVTKFSASYGTTKVGFETPEKRDFCKFARNSYSSTGKPFYNVLQRRVRPFHLNFWGLKDALGRLQGVN